MRVHALFSALLLLFAAPAQPTPTADQEFLDATHAIPNAEQGARYFTTCASCHGPHGQGTPDGQIPRIAGQYPHVIARQLIAFRHGQRWDIRMEPFASPHLLPNAQAIADVAQYASTLYDASPPGTGSGEQLAHGARVYFRLCESCHGPSGQGDPQQLIPRIGGQHYEYLRRQIYDAVDGRRPGFPAAHTRLLAPLDRDQIAGVADYLSRLAPRPRN